MKPVEIVKISELLTIYKNGIEAESIQVARISELNSDSICQFNIIVGKNLYNINDQVLYIQPDYCIPNNSIFKDYYEPFGDPKKSKLGSNGRIRACKFNFNFKDEFDSIYSNGILLPLSILDFDVTSEMDLQKKLSVIKYIAPDNTEGGSAGLSKGDLPDFLYATDETRIELLYDHVNNCFLDSEELSFTIKRDGSSTTIYNKIDSNTNEHIYGICSRLQEKKLEQSYTSAYIDTDGNNITHYFNKETNEKGFYNMFTETFYTIDQVKEKNLQPITIEVRDSFVDTVKEKDYLTKLNNYCIENNFQLALRGELIGGGGSKGSGNKLNQDKNQQRDIIWFGVDDLSFGKAKRINYSDPINNLKTLCEKLGMSYTPEINSGIYDYKGIINYCNSVFSEIKEKTGQIIEGIVIRSKYSNRLSTKYINPEYDSKN